MTWQCRFDVTMTLLLRHVSTGCKLGSFSKYNSLVCVDWEVPLTCGDGPMATCWYNDMVSKQHIDSLVQDCSNSSALTMEILQSCSKPSLWAKFYKCWNKRLTATLLTQKYLIRTGWIKLNDDQWRMLEIFLYVRKNTITNGLTNVQTSPCIFVAARGLLIRL